MRDREQLIKDIDSALLGAAVFYTILQYVEEGESYEDKNARLRAWMESENMEGSEFDYDGKLFIRWPLDSLIRITRDTSIDRCKKRIVHFNESIGSKVDSMEESLKEGQALTINIEQTFQQEIENEQRIYQFPLKTTLAKIAGIPIPNVEVTS